MGQKVAPKIFRMGITERSNANWYADDNKFPALLHQDIKIRKVIVKLVKAAGIEKIIVSRTSNNIYVDLHVARPGIAIGKGGSGIELLEKTITQEIGEKVKISVHEVKQPFLSATLVANAVAESIARRLPPKVAMRQQIDKIEASGAKGARIQCSGQGQIKMSRTEKVEMVGGKIPLTTLRAKVDYGYASVLSERMYGIKVWIYKGEL